ncbi:hypothetical protein [Rhodoferax sp.]|uniref:hypothetical protein n=1 Tax=Rhodoferax sp. TaxID=50421 RepID=UPI0019E8BD82|nr:hypothetical protein [Rhodoferax sp.]MBE0473454.1 hypothetical protein [Rhodoferax sp.]
MIAGVALTWPAQAQTIYRCGNAYSQLPCPGAVPLELNDARLPEQKLQTDAAAITDARLANAMAQQRLAEEQRQLANNQPVPQGAASAPAKPLAKAVGTKKQKQKKPKVKKRASPAQK